MAIGSSKAGVLGSGSVPAGCITINSSTTWVAPAGVKKVSVVGVGSSGTSGNAGNAGNKGYASGGGAGGSPVWYTTQYCAGYSQYHSFGRSSPGGNGGPPFDNKAQTAYSCAYSKYEPNGQHGGHYAQVNCANIDSFTKNTIKGTAGKSGPAGCAGSAGSAGSAGTSSSALGITFPGGAAGNAGNAGSGGPASTGGGAGHAAAMAQKQGSGYSFNGYSGTKNAMTRGKGGAAGAGFNGTFNHTPQAQANHYYRYMGTLNNQSGWPQSSHYGRSMYSYGTQPTNTPTTNCGTVGTYHLGTIGAGGCGFWCQATSFTLGGWGGDGAGNLQANKQNGCPASPAYYGQERGVPGLGGRGAIFPPSACHYQANQFYLSSQSGYHLNQLNYAHSINNPTNAQCVPFGSGGGGGGGGAGQAGGNSNQGNCTQHTGFRANCWRLQCGWPHWCSQMPYGGIYAGGGGGGGGMAQPGTPGGAGGSGGTASPQTSNCVSVTAGGSYPITVAPGASVKISWKSQ